MARALLLIQLHCRALGTGIYGWPYVKRWLAVHFPPLDLVKVVPPVCVLVIKGSVGNFSAPLANANAGINLNYGFGDRVMRTAQITCLYSKS